MADTLRRFKQSLLIEAPVKKVFAFFSDPRNLQALTPDFLDFQVLGSLDQGTRAGQLIDYRLRYKGLPLRWRTLISQWDPPHGFVDVAVQSPYAFWNHQHRFVSAGRRTRMTDSVLYSLPFGRLGDWVAGAAVAADVERIFEHRSRVIRGLFPSKAPRTP